MGNKETIDAENTDSPNADSTLDSNNPTPIIPEESIVSEQTSTEIKNEENGETLTTNTTVETVAESEGSIVLIKKWLFESTTSTTTPTPTDTEQVKSREPTPSMKMTK